MIRLTALLLFSPAVLQAAEFRSLEFFKDGDRYVVESDIYLEAPPDGVYRVLTDYEGFPELSSIFVEGRMLEPVIDGSGLVFLHMKGCVLFFCRDVRLVERLEVVPETRVEVFVDPERSDLDYGWARWDIAAEGGGALVRYEMEMVPQFWIPPVIGPLIIKAALRLRGLRAARRLEAVASGRPIPEDIRVQRS
ncbi:MAG: SRPBCC family protein [Gammaproteobacteria bacterium]|jgi:hypothetical protein